MNSYNFNLIKIIVSEDEFIEDSNVLAHKFEDKFIENKIFKD